jgi:transcription elongation factor Elf1
MRVSKHNKDIWRQALKFISKCPICSAVYNVQNAELFAQNNSAYLVHITCGKCESYFILMVLMLGQSLSSVGMVTDLNLADAKRLYQAGAVTLNEALNGYKAIDNINFNSLILNGK